MANTEHIFAVSGSDFAKQVLELSVRTPVLVDFWAAWCGPCQMVTPVLEQLAARYDGKLIIAKVDTDAEQELAAEWGVRSLPTLKLFRNSQVVDEVIGVQPEQILRALVEPHLPRLSDALLDQAHAAHTAGEPDHAAELLARARDQDPANPGLIVELAGLKADLGDLEATETLLDELPVNKRGDAKVKALRARIGFARALDSESDHAELRCVITQQPDNLDARYQLGAGCALDGDPDTALGEFLEIMRRDRGFGDDLGRKALLDAFDLLGEDNPLVAQYRRRMASLLY